MPDNTTETVLRLQHKSWYRCLRTCPRLELVCVHTSADGSGHMHFVDRRIMSAVASTTEGSLVKVGTTHKDSRTWWKNQTKAVRLDLC